MRLAPKLGRRQRRPYPEEPAKAGVSKDRRWLALLAAVILASPAAADPISIGATPLTLDRIAEIEAAPLPDGTRLTWLGGLTLVSPDSRFGGISGMAMSGLDRFFAVTDRGDWITARMTWAGDRPAGLTDAHIVPLTYSDGKRLRGRGIDAEGLSMLPRAGGGWEAWVSFEQTPRIRRYPVGPDGLPGTPADIAMPRNARIITGNQGLEGITVLPGGTLLVVAEETFDARGLLIGWTGPQGGLRDIRVAPQAGFAVTDLEALPDGRLLLLERRASFFGGFSAALRLVPAGAVSPGAVLDGERLMRLSAVNAVDNLEALTAVPEGNGRYRLIMMSDDNFRAFQTTQLLVFRLELPVRPRPLPRARPPS